MPKKRLSGLVGRHKGGDFTVEVDMPGGKCTIPLLSISGVNGFTYRHRLNDAEAAALSAKGLHITRLGPNNHELSIGD